MAASIDCSDPVGASVCRHQSLESTAEQLRLRSVDFLRDHDIELITEKEVSLAFLPGRKASAEGGGVRTGRVGDR